MRPLHHRVVAGILALATLLASFVYPVPSALAATTISDCSDHNSIEAQLEAGGDFVFDCGVVTIVFDSPIEIAGTTAVDGAGLTTLSGGNTTRIFEVLPLGALALLHVNLTAGTSNGSGGAIFNDGGSLTVTEATVDFSNADLGGGAIASQFGVLNLDAATIVQSSAEDGGGILVVGGAAVIVNSTINGNTAGSYGGGVFAVNANLTVVGGSIGSNSASIGGGIALDGSISFSDVASVDITLNFASEQGGGIFHFGGELTLDEVVVHRNTALGQGGGVFSHHGQFAVTESEVSGNAAFSGAGLALLGDDQSSVIEMTAIRQNGAASTGGGIYQEGGSLKITASDIDRNNADATSIVLGGGGIYSTNTESSRTGQSLTITGTHITANEGETGGGIQFSSDGNTTGSMTISDSVISENSALQGGGISSAYGNAVEIESSAILDNMATYSGGGIESGGFLSIDSSTIAGNKAILWDGGGIRSYGDLIVTDSFIVSNVAEEAGGGISSRYKLTLDHSLIDSNTSEIIGGGVLIAGGGTITNSKIVNNTAVDGGGLFVEDFGLNIVQVNKTTFAYNHGDLNGGGIFAGQDVLVNIAHSLFLGNTATLRGGGLDVRESAEIDVANSSFSANTASEGGAIANLNGEVSLLYVSIANNTAGAGSGLESDFGVYTMRASLLDGNAGDNCAAIVVSNGANLSDDDSCNFGANDFENTPALLGSLQDNGGPTHTHALKSGSPAIDQAPCDRPEDQRGVARPYDGNNDGQNGCDIGAYERIFILFHPDDLPSFPALVSARPGSIVDVRFSYGGRAELQRGYPQVAVIDCRSTEALRTGEQARSADGRRLRYDPRTGQYVFRWQTSPAWSGSCRQLILAFADGNIERLNFRFRR